jgi:hypothetical protein
MYINYDLARTLTEERQRRSTARAQTRRLRQRAPEPTATIPMAKAEVIELEFGTHCGTDQIGA